MNLPRPLRPVLVGSVTLLFTAAGEAIEPLLTIELLSGAVSRHALSAVESVEFLPDQLLVTEGGGAEFAYLLDTLRYVGFDLSGDATGLDEPGGAASLTRAIHLFQNWPNPVALATSIAFDVPRDGEVSLTLHDVRGARVRTLVGGARLEAGEHVLRWDGRDERGERVASGAYFYRLLAPGVDETRRLVYLR